MKRMYLGLGAVTLVTAVLGLGFLAEKMGIFGAAAGNPLQRQPLPVATPPAPAALSRVPIAEVEELSPLPAVKPPPDPPPSKIRWRREGASLPVAFIKAEELMKQGVWSGAHALYQAVLQEVPGHPEALERLQVMGQRRFPPGERCDPWRALWTATPFVGAPLEIADGTPGAFAGRGAQHLARDCGVATGGSLP